MARSVYSDSWRAGDQQSSAFAHGCVEAGDAKTTYGTGAFLLNQQARSLCLMQKGYLQHPGVRLNSTLAYNRTCLEGSVFVEAIVGWLQGRPWADRTVKRH